MNMLLLRLQELSRTTPNKLAVAFKKEQLTYSELFDRILGMSVALKEYGIESGDKVSFIALSKPEMIVTYMAIQAIGAVAVFLDKNAVASNIYEIYNLSDSKILLCDKSLGEYAEKCNIVSLKETYAASCKETVGEVAVYMPGDDEIGELLYTSGTTGRAKGVMLSYKAIYSILSNTIEGIGICEEDRVLVPLPLNHSFALRVLRAVLYSGATVILQNGFTFAKEVENNVVNFDCNAFVAVPSSYEIVKGQMQDKFVEIMGRMRYIEFGAGSLSIKQRREITTSLPDTIIYNTWGSSESGGAIFCNVSEVVLDDKKAGTLGKTIDGVDIKFIDSNGADVKTNSNRPGRMVLRGDMQMSGYYGQEDMTEATLKDGWLITGDMAYQDEDGYIYMLGRADDIIKVSGENVSPIEIEEVANQCELVRDCACIGVVDETGLLGQMPVLFVVANHGYTDEELHKFIAERVERFKLPQKYIVIDSIPRNKMQKIDRKELHRLWENKDSLELINPVIQNILSRRSVRKFSDENIPQSILDIIVKVGYYAPSGHNMQSWQFTVITKEADIQLLKEKTRVAAEKNRVHFYGFENPKALILVSNNVKNPDGCQDASCASENMMLAANSYGIGSVWLNPLMTLRDVEPIKEVLDQFGIPEDHNVWSMIALGYPVAEPPLLQKRTDVVHYV